MRKLFYVFALLAVTCIVSCKKDNNSPAPTNTTNSGNTGGDIYTVAGDGVAEYNGDGVPATSTGLCDPINIAIDKAGNIYIADECNVRIRKVSINGIISTIAGNGTQGYSGDGGMATAAELSVPSGVAVDNFGNVYIADWGNSRVRKVNTSGIITTFAGNGSGGNSGDGGPATAARIASPQGLTVDHSGNVYATSGGCIRKINPSGIISTVAGGGTSGLGDGGPATAAELNFPVGMAIDGSGNIYISDEGNYRIRKVNTSGIISTIAGNGTAGNSGNNRPATAAELNNPIGVAVDGSGNIYIADSQNNLIRIVNTSGIISNFAGNGIQGSSGDDGPAIAAELSHAWGVSVDAAGNVYIADSYNARVRVVYK